MTNLTEIRAEVCLPTTALTDDIAFFTKTLRMQMDVIYPADDPSVAVFSGHGLRVRLDNAAQGGAGRLHISTDDPTFTVGILTSPGGTVVEIGELNPPVHMPPTDHAFVVRRLADQAPWVIGRAGMHYRDLIPTRLGGSIIASHIRIPDGGPVPDMVHFHRVGFQLIYCYRGWVDVVYEDQGGPIRLHAGDCFIQPPEIRRRVLEASDGIEVIEIDPQWAKHDADIHFTFVMEGGMTLEGDGKDPYRLAPGDAFVIPPGMATRYSDPTSDLELLEVTLAGTFNTTMT